MRCCVTFVSQEPKLVLALACSSVSGVQFPSLLFHKVLPIRCSMLCRPESELLFLVLTPPNATDSTLTAFLFVGLLLLVRGFLTLIRVVLIIVIIVILENQSSLGGCRLDRGRRDLLLLARRAW